jgi:predicted metalloprotease
VYLDLDFYQQLADERGLDGGSIADCNTLSARS